MVNSQTVNVKEGHNHPKDHHFLHLHCLLYYRSIFIFIFKFIFPFVFISASNMFIFQIMNKNDILINFSVVIFFIISRTQSSSELRSSNSSSCVLLPFFFLANLELAMTKTTSVIVFSSNGSFFLYEP